MPKKATSPYRVAVVQHPPVALNRPKTLARGVELLDEAAAGGAKLVSFPETWVPGYPGVGLAPASRRRLWAEQRHSQAAARELGRPEGRTAEADPGRGATVEVDRFDRNSRAGRRVQPRDALQLGRPHRAGRRDPEPAPQAGAHQPRAHGVGRGGRHGAAGQRHAFGAGWRPHLLGELHASGALRDLRPGLRDLHRADVGRGRHVAVDDAAHRRRRTVLGARQREQHAGQGHSDGLSRTEAVVPGPRGLVQPGRLGDRRSGWQPWWRGRCTRSTASCTPTATRRVRRPPSERSTWRATTDGRTSSASRSIEEPRAPVDFATKS